MATSQRRRVNANRLCRRVDRHPERGDRLAGRTKALSIRCRRHEHLGEIDDADEQDIA